MTRSWVFLGALAFLLTSLLAGCANAPKRLPPITNSIGMAFVFIPPGEFLMGRPENEDGRIEDERQHKVKLTKGFYLAATEVTQAQWKAVMGEDKNPSHFKGEDLPVEQVSWDEAVEFCRKLSQKEGKNYRLPTEAEWEYACRAGTTTQFHTGKTISADLANFDGNYVYGNGVKGVYRQKTIPVGSFKPNRWGLFDMHGNVCEWCADWYDPYPASDGPVIDPQGPPTGDIRVLRGGSWGDDPGRCRSATRLRFFPDLRNYSLGFRLALEP